MTAQANLSERAKSRRTRNLSVSKIVFKAENLTKTYLTGDVAVRALRGVDLELFEGEVAVMLGPSGSGKSTYRKALDVDQEFSLDDLRIELYGDDYTEAFKASTEDKNFRKKANSRFIEMIKTGDNVIVDNTNISKKSRRFYITEARRHGYQVHAIVFPISLQTLLDRQRTRDDKTVPESVVRNMYNKLQMPSYGEFDHIWAIGSNLPT